MSALRHFLRDDDLTPDEQADVLSLAADLKAAPHAVRSLEGPRTVALIFDKPTLRTQTSFAAGIAELGGFPMTVDGSLAGIGVRESVADVARVLGRQAAAVVWRGVREVVAMGRCVVRWFGAGHQAHRVQTPRARSAWKAVRKASKRPSSRAARISRIRFR